MLIRSFEEYRAQGKRRKTEELSAQKTVEEILGRIKEEGDKALFDYTLQFDKLDLQASPLTVTEEEIARAYDEVDGELLAALRRAKDNILGYHEKQVRRDDIREENGNRIGWRFVPLGRVGIYVPGGKATYPSSVLMCALPAVAAGVGEIIMCTPGYRNPLTLVAARECGISRIFKVGGAQAIAAMAYGTESIPKADLIAGPGRNYVAIAKKLVYGECAIDMIAGPSEILIIADESADPVFLAADFLSQAEHDEQAKSVLLTTSLKLAGRCEEEILRQVKLLPRREIAEKAFENSAIIVTKSVAEACDFANEIAPEHLELCLENAREVVKDIRNAGAVFVGNYSPEPLGDYFAGPSHVLPTDGTAKFFSVLNVDNFVRRVSYIEYGERNLKAAAKDIIAIAECEGLSAHANSVRVRLNPNK